MIQTQQAGRQEFSDRFAKVAASNCNQTSQAPPAAQTPTEFATALVQGLESLNGHLAELRYALFRDEGEPSTPAELAADRFSLLDSLAKAHWLMSSASEQLGNTLRRL